MNEEVIRSVRTRYDKVSIPGSISSVTENLNSSVEIYNSVVDQINSIASDASLLNNMIIRSREEFPNLEADLAEYYPDSVGRTVENYRRDLEIESARRLETLNRRMQDNVDRRVALVYYLAEIKRSIVGRLGREEAALRDRLEEARLNWDYAELVYRRAGENLNSEERTAALTQLNRLRNEVESLRVAITNVRYFADSFNLTEEENRYFANGFSLTMGANRQTITPQARIYYDGIDKSGLEEIRRRTPITSEPVPEQDPAEVEPELGQNPVEEEPELGQDPVEEEPVSEQDPVEEEPVPEQDPVEEEPVSEQDPVEEEPVSEQDPVEEEPVPEQDPVEEEPVPEQDPVEVEPESEELIQVVKRTPWQWVKDHKKQILIALGITALIVASVVVITQLLPAIAASAQATQTAGALSQMMSNGSMWSTAVASEQTALHGANVALSNLVTSATGVANTFNPVTGIWTIGSSSLPAAAQAAAAKAAAAKASTALLSKVALGAGIGGLGTLGAGLLIPKRSEEYKRLNALIKSFKRGLDVEEEQNEARMAELANMIYSSNRLSDEERRILLRRLSALYKKLRNSQRRQIQLPEEDLDEDQYQGPAQVEDETQVEAQVEDEAQVQVEDEIQVEDETQVENQYQEEDQYQDEDQESLGRARI